MFFDTIRTLLVRVECKAIDQLSKSCDCSNSYYHKVHGHLHQYCPVSGGCICVIFGCEWYRNEWDSQKHNWRCLPVPHCTDVHEPWDRLGWKFAGFHLDSYGAAALDHLEVGSCD